VVDFEIFASQEREWSLADKTALVAVAMRGRGHPSFLSVCGQTRTQTYVPLLTSRQVSVVTGRNFTQNFQALNQEKFNNII